MIKRYFIQHLRQPAQAGKPPQVYVHDSDNAAVADIACVRQSNKQNSVFWKPLNVNRSTPINLLAW